ncbi:MAG: protoheme IX farnesyltransferase [Deltaproteobacteria bacterium GWA2_45_12]|nr:MAG: protoheme IX farnesyltransferase [Deltaproteobacteria bacterium GWA2_45_12]
MIRHLLNLTKPRISLLFAITGLTAILVDGTRTSPSLWMWLVSLAIFLVGGAANGFNQFFERDIDRQMVRTAKKRPIPQGKVSPRMALIFSIVLAIVGNVMLYELGGFWSFFWGVFTIVFYSFYYTLWLKPRTPYNIVIGGAAGATAPLIAWSAVTGNFLGLVPFLMFLIVFIWTPPHFWSLALYYKEDYEKVSYPMFPNIKGDKATKSQIFWYSALLFPVALSLYFFGILGVVYLVGAFILNLVFLYGAWMVMKKNDTKIYRKFFAYSIFYLLLLFALMMADKMIPIK